MTIADKFVYKVERKSPRSKFYVVRKFLRHYAGLGDHFDDLPREVVSIDLSYDQAHASCDQLNGDKKEKSEPR